MTEMLDDGIERQSLKDYTESAYLNYSMYVIMDRALPNIADGLKPVQRRLVYAMSALGLKASAKYVKSARTIGDVLGKFHPHGDAACYEAMVIMAQPFSYRYPLVDGQGNWGSADDPKSFAAMRYTESRLTPYADLLLGELAQGTVDWSPNFDGTLEEPKVLPARLPNLLLNGTTGIAVGMSTDVPPHNLREVAQACIALLQDPGLSLDDICEIVPGPDYPTEAEIITPKNELINMYASGKGSIRMRATYEVENGDIVINALPHQVSGGKVLEQIAAQMQAKKLPMVSDLRDECDHETPTRYVIVPRSNRIDVEQLMLHLFASTDLERTYRVNMNVIGINGKPQTKNLMMILSEWLEFRRTTVRNRLQYRLDKVLDRLHILDGLLTAFLNLDEVIEIIRREDQPKYVMMERFGISDRQAEAILEIKLRQLAKLEEIKIRDEQAALAKERDDLEKTLGSNARLKKLIIKELKEDAEQFGDNRRSPLVNRTEAQALSQTELMSADPVTVVVSQKGWVRSAKGHEVDAAALNYRAGDNYLASAKGKSNETVAFIDSFGRSYALPAHTLPSARGLGDPLTGHLNPASGAEFMAVLMSNNTDKFLVSSDAGYGFITSFADMVTKNKAGKGLLNLPLGAKVMAPARVLDNGDEYIVSITNEGRLLMFDVGALPEMARGKGNKMISIPSAKVASREEFVIATTVITQDDEIQLFAGKRKLKLKFRDLEHYVGERGRRGSKLPRGLQRVETMEVIRGA